MGRSPPKELQDIAWELREQALRMLYESGSGHPGGKFIGGRNNQCIVF